MSKFEVFINMVGFHMDIHIEINILGFHPNQLNLGFDDIIGSIMDGYKFHLVITNIFLMMTFYQIQ
jgi:hypothetical protein